MASLPLTYRSFGIVVLVLVATLSGCFSNQIKENMTMAEVERLVGKPDHVENVKGSSDARFESPPIIRWVYSKFPVTTSGPEYGKPGHINFVPIRFTKYEKNQNESDKTARQYGEQSGTFRATSFVGSFPTEKKDWDNGDLDFVPVKEINKEGK